MTLRGPLPRLLLIGDRFTDPQVRDRIIEAASSGVHWIQLRDHEAEASTFLTAATSLADALRALSPDLLISVNTRVGVAERLGCAVHVGKRGPVPADVRSLIQPGMPVGRSVHTVGEMVRQNVEYFLWSPVFETTSKPGRTGTGIDGLREACSSVGSIPVIAMGGITAERIGPCVKAGAYGVAVLSGILAADNIRDSVTRYLEAIEREGA